MSEINPFDIMSGKVVQNEHGTFWFKEPMSTGDNLNGIGHPIYERLHRENDLPAAVWKNGYKSWWVDGVRHRTTGPAIISASGGTAWRVNGERLTENEFNEYVRQNKPI